MPKSSKHENPYVPFSKNLLNPRPRASRRSCRVAYANIRGLYKNLSDCLFWPEMEMCFFLRVLCLPDATFPSLWFRVLADWCSCSWVRLIGLDGWLYTCDRCSAYRQRGYECGCCEVVVVRICNSSHNFYIFLVYRNPDLSDKIFHCLLPAMAKVYTVDRKESFLFDGDVNAHHEEWIFYDKSSRLGCAWLRFIIGLWVDAYEAYTHWWRRAWLSADWLFECCEGLGWLASWNLGPQAVFIGAVLEQPIPHLACM